MSADFECRKIELQEWKDLQGMAEEIWWAVYPKVIGREQVEYMLSRSYAEDALKQRIACGSEWGIMEAQQPVGHLSARPFDAKEIPELSGLAKPASRKSLFVDRLYVLPTHQRRGHGQRSLNWLYARSARAKELAGLSLRVNRDNLPAVRAYKKNGFEVLGTFATSIGNGFVMDDYWMERRER